MGASLGIHQNSSSTHSSIPYLNVTVGKWIGENGMGGDGVRVEAGDAL